jgi:predicted O-linked N-acetylglucosamine transferase (SPINDLY family)
LADQLNPRNIVAILRLAEGVNSDTEDGKKKKLDYLKIAHEIDPKNARVNHMLGHFFFELKQFIGAQEHFDLAFKLDEKLVEAAASAIYLRFSICNWGKNGTQYRNDVKSLTDIATAERDRFLFNNKSHEVSVIHPHMALGYAINSEHKLAISKSYAENEKIIAVWSGLQIFDDTSEESRSQYRSESQKAGFRLKVGYVSANIKSKTTVYMAQVSAITIYDVHQICVSPVHTCCHQWDEVSSYLFEKLSS